MANSQAYLEVKYKQPTNYYVGTSRTDTTALGGFYEDLNVPKKLIPTIAKLTPRNSFEVIVQTNTAVTLENGKAGFPIYIINKTKTTYNFLVQDSQLNLIRQVYYNNKWQDIETFAKSDCGNSSHTIYIKSKEYWLLKAPWYSGKKEAKFRFKLRMNYAMTLDLNTDSFIYSNEFEGSFNENQVFEEWEIESK